MSGKGDGGDGDGDDDGGGADLLRSYPLLIPSTHGGKGL